LFLKRWLTAHFAHGRVHDGWQAETRSGSHLHDQLAPPCAPCCAGMRVSGTWLSISLQRECAAVDVQISDRRYGSWAKVGTRVARAGGPTGAGVVRTQVGQLDAECSRLLSLRKLLCNEVAVMAWMRRLPKAGCGAPLVGRLCGARLQGCTSEAYEGRFRLHDDGSGCTV
jgi:hypothetical protein